MCKPHRVTYIMACGHYRIDSEGACPESSTFTEDRDSRSPCIAFIRLLESQRLANGWEWTYTAPDGSKIHVSMISSSSHCKSRGINLMLRQTGARVADLAKTTLSKDDPSSPGLVETVQGTSVNAPALHVKPPQGTDIARSEKPKKRRATGLRKFRRILCFLS